VRARLTLARALLREPPVLLLDEPGQNLDPVAGGGFRDTLNRLVAVRKAAVLMATHDLTETSRLGARTIALSDGMIVSRTFENADAIRPAETILSEPGR